MSIIPDEELKSFGSLNLAPMVDFLFLVVAVFATLAVTKAALFDRQVQLVKVQTSSENTSDVIGHNDYYIINLSINANGEYKWITEFNEYLMNDVKTIQSELKRQQDLSLLPKDKTKTKVLLHIDKSAQWEPISQVIFAVREVGFSIHPVYDYSYEIEKGEL